MKTLEFIKTNKSRFDLLTHSLSESAWFQTQADTDQKSQASVIKADLLKAIKDAGMQTPDTNKGLFDLIKIKMAESKEKEVLQISASEGYMSSLGGFFKTLFN